MPTRIVKGPFVHDLLLSLAAPSQDHTISFQLEFGGTLELHPLTITRESGSGMSFIVEGFLSGCPFVQLFYDTRDCTGVILSGDESLFAVLEINLQNEIRHARQAN
jgi:hypothetical protein